MLVALQLALFSTFAAYAFKMRNVHMQTTVTRFCNPDMLGPDGKPVKCYISNSMETRGLVLPGMDDNRSLTIRQDIFVTQDGQLTVGASPDRPYEYFVIHDTINHTHMMELFNKTSFLVYKGEPRKAHKLMNVNYDLTLEEIGWINHGLVEVGGRNLTKRVMDGVHGVDPKTKMNYTALAMTGLMPNSWTLYTDETDKEMVQLLATNTFQNNTIYQETKFTYWKELPANVTENDTLQMVFSAYNIERHDSRPPRAREAPQAEDIFIDSEVTGERCRDYFEDGKRPDWMPHSQFRGSNTAVGGSIEYFKIIDGSASQKFFLAKYEYLTAAENGANKFELPRGCVKDTIVSHSPYCLYVNFESNKTSLALDFYMRFDDVNLKSNKAHLNITVFYSSEGDVLNFAFDAAGCAVIFQEGVSFAKLYIQVCVSGSGAGKSLLQPDNATYRGAAEISISFNIDVPVVPTISVTLKAGFTCQGAPNNNISASAYLGLSTSLAVVGADISVSVFGNSVGHKANVWEFESYFNLKVWVDLWLYSDDWTWSWPLWKAGPVTF